MISKNKLQNFLPIGVIIVTIGIIYYMLQEKNTNTSGNQMNYRYTTTANDSFNTTTHSHIITSQKEDSIMENTTKMEQQMKGTNKSKDAVHIVLCFDQEGLTPFVAMLHSILANVNAPVVIHIIVTSNEVKGEVEKKIGCIKKPSYLKINVTCYELSESIQKLIKIHDSEKQYLNSSGNFVRFFLDSILSSDVNYVLYLDVDIIVKQDIRILWNEVDGMEQLFAAVPEGRFRRKDAYFTSRKIYFKRYHKNMNSSTLSFNAGILGINLKKWREKNLHDEMLFWMDQNSKARLWRIGTQPIINVLGHDDYKRLSFEWNVSVGRNMYKTAFNHVFIHHWNGKCKPWKGCKQNRKWRHVWEMYGKKGLCNNNGNCVAARGEDRGVCNCTVKYHGDYCSES